MGDRTKLARSRLLQMPKFAGLVDEYIPSDETVIEATDSIVEVFDGTKMRAHNDLVVVLTNRRLLALRGRGMFGGKAPMTIDLASVTETGVTKQGNVSVEIAGAYGEYGWWKLLFSDARISDHWMQLVHAASSHSRGEARGSAPSSAWQECRTRLQSFFEALAPLAKPDMIGKPFGEGFGLEHAVTLISKHFLNSADAREADKIVSIDIIAATGNRIHPEDLNKVMGATEQAFRKSGFVPAQFAPIVSLAGAAKSFFGQFDEDGADIWELWKQRDDVAAEFLCWHAVARLRLATAGKLSPV